MDRLLKEESLIIAIEREVLIHSESSISEFRDLPEVDSKVMELLIINMFYVLGGQLRCFPNTPRRPLFRFAIII